MQFKCSASQRFYEQIHFYFPLWNKSQRRFCRFCWMTWSGPSERMKMLGLVPTISWQISQPYSKLFFGREVVRLFPTHQLAPTKIFAIPVPLTRLVNDGCFRILGFSVMKRGLVFLTQWLTKINWMRLLVVTRSMDKVIYPKHSKHWVFTFICFFRIIAF